MTAILPPEIRKLLAFGTGVGIAIRDADLEAAVVRVRPSGTQVPGRTTIRDFRGRPAAEWGRQYTAFLKSCGASHLTATVLLPRQDVIVRQIALPGVTGKDLASAVALQIDTLHPWGEEEVQYGWTPLSNGVVLVGIMRRDVMERYLGLFSEAGISVACFTFSAGAVYAAIRLISPPAGRLLAVTPTEIYGESPSRPILSAEFELPVEQAIALAVAELRLDPETQPVTLDQVLPAPRVNPIENDLARDPLPYATALAGACPWLTPLANLLPPDRRISSSRTRYIPTSVLAALLVLAVGALAAFPKIEDRQYLRKLASEIAGVEPQAARAQTLDRQIDAVRGRSRLLDDFRNRSRMDLDALNELTRLLPPPVWANLIELNRDSANINGEAEQAAPLLGAVDASPCFQNSEFSIIAKNGNNETFRLHTVREGCK